MELTWKNPFINIVKDIVIGSTEFRVIGTYFEGCKESPDRSTPEEKPDFEIEKILLLVDTPSGIVPLDITKLLDDLGTVSSDQFEYFHETILKDLNSEYGWAEI